LKTKALLFALTCFAISLNTMANVIDNKEELEALVNGYEKLAIDAQKCTDSSNLKSAPCRKFIRVFNDGEINDRLGSFGNNLELYISIDQEMALKGIIAVGTIADTLGFVFEERAKTVQKRK